MVTAGESETVEFKSTTGTRREAAMTVCAMLNQQGDRVLFGVSPEGRMVGQQVSERTIEEVTAEFARIDPPAFPEIERIPVEGGREIIAVSVGRGPAGPYMYRGSAYRRMGSSTIEMRADEYRRLLFERMHSERRWENQPAEGWTVADLDVTEVRNTVAEAVRIGRLNEPGGRNPEDLLRGLGLLRGGVLFRAAAVLFGKTERLESEMPQCLLRVARFRGLDRSEFLDNRQFNGNAFTLLASAERFLRDTLPIASRFESGRVARIDEPLYPPLATREALANALCHRDYAMGGSSIGVAVYDDRLEVTDRPASLRADARRSVRPARVPALESPCRPHSLSPGHHRGMGPGDDQDGGARYLGGVAASGDRGASRLCDRSVPAGRCWVPGSATAIWSSGRRRFSRCWKDGRHGARSLPISDACLCEWSGC